MKLFRKLFTCIMATLLTVVACFGLTGCAKEDIVQVEIKIQVYNTEDSEFYAEDEVVLTIDLYRHLAPKTCDAIIDYINDTKRLDRKKLVSLLEEVKNQLDNY